MTRYGFCVNLIFYQRVVKSLFLLNPGMGMGTIQENIDLCLKRIEGVCARTGRFSEDVTLVVVTKGVRLPLIYEALDCGIVHIGEGRIQEVLGKYDALSAYAKKHKRQVIWHMIGHLQTNKVKEAVRIFDLIHSLDSIHLAREVDFEARKISKMQDVLIQVNVVGEASKFGFPYETVEDVLGQLKGFKNINIKGFMTIAPFTDDFNAVRMCFRRLKELRDAIGHAALSILSMGMTHDFEIAVEEGATMVRIGTAIFGERKV